MKVKPLYFVGFVLYVASILISYHFFGITGAGLAGVAGIVGPAIGLLINAIVLKPDGDEIDEKPVPQHEQQSFVETLEERRERAKSRLDDHLTLRENTEGDIEIYLNEDEIAGNDRKAMLYVFGQWARAKADPQLSPIVTKREIRENTPHKGRAVGVFLNKMAHYLERHYSEDPMKQRKMDEEDMEFELNENYLEEIVEYILGEREAPN